MTYHKINVLPQFQIIMYKRFKKEKHILATKESTLHQNLRTVMFKISARSLIMNKTLTVEYSMLQINLTEIL